MENALFSYRQSQKKHKRNTVLETVCFKKFSNTAKGVFFPKYIG